MNAWSIGMTYKMTKHVHMIATLLTQLSGWHTKKNRINKLTVIDSDIRIVL